MYGAKKTTANMPRVQNFVEKTRLSNGARDALLQDGKRNLADDQGLHTPEATMTALDKAILLVCVTLLIPIIATIHEMITATRDVARGRTRGPRPLVRIVFVAFLAMSAHEIHTYIRTAQFTVQTLRDDQAYADVVDASTRAFDADGAEALRRAEDAYQERVREAQSLLSE